MVHRPAHHVKQVLTPLQLDLRVRSALLGHMLVRLDHLSAQNVLLDRHQQLVHRRAMSAHHAKQGTTTL
jgi:hypothetical protein